MAFRQKQKDSSGRNKAVGSLMIDVRTRFASCRRIARATGVYPDDRNAKQTVADIKAMIRNLSNTGDEETLLKIKAGTLTLLDALRYWRQDRLDLAYGNEHKSLVKELQVFNQEALVADATRANYERNLRYLIQSSFVKQDTIVGQLPQVAENLRTYFAQQRKADQFNAFRVYLLSFVTRHLLQKKTSPLYVKIHELEPLRVVQRKKHHPLESPREMFSLFRRIDALPNVTEVRKELYKEDIMMMCFHGFRASEFRPKKYVVDRETGHLQILGTKTANARRVVPLMVPTSALARDPVSYSSLYGILNAIDVPTAPRDFRRTYSIWLEAAGVTASRISAYMGHSAQSMTERYQLRAARIQQLNEDRDKLRRWIESELSVVESRRNVAATAADPLIHLSDVIEDQSDRLAEVAYRALSSGTDKSR